MQTHALILLIDRIWICNEEIPQEEPDSFYGPFRDGPLMGSLLLIGRLVQAFPPHPCECLLDHYAETDSLGAAHTHIFAHNSRPTCTHANTHTTAVTPPPYGTRTHTHTPNLPNLCPRRQTRTEAREPDMPRSGPAREVKQILWSNSSFSIAFVQ